MKKLFKIAQVFLFSAMTAVLTLVSPIMASDTSDVLIGSNPQTGDSNPLLAWVIVLLALAALGIVAAVIISIISKKKKK